MGAVVLASYCVTNLAAAGGFLRASGRWPARCPAPAAAGLSYSLAAVAVLRRGAATG